MFIVSNKYQIVDNNVDNNLDDNIIINMYQTGFRY